MRFLIFMFAFLVSSLAHAGDIRIHVDYAYSEYRVQPDPGPRTAHSSIDVVMGSDSKIEEHYRSEGRHPISGSTNNRMGDKKFQVVDSHTITRRTQNMMTTIVVSGSSCEAKVQVIHPAFSAMSTQLGVKAVYRDFKILQTSCRIE